MDDCLLTQGQDFPAELELNLGETLALFVPYRPKSAQTLPFLPKTDIGSVGGNRTCIWSFGDSYTIHCTTTPFWLICWSVNWLGEQLFNRSTKQLLYQTVCIKSKDLYRNGEQYYAKKFPHRYQSGRAQCFFNQAHGF